MKCTIQNLRIKGRMRTCVVQIFSTYGRPERGIQNVMIWGQIRKCDIQHRVRRQSCVLGVAGWLKSKKPRINNPCFEIFVLYQQMKQQNAIHYAYYVCLGLFIHNKLETQTPLFVGCGFLGSQIKKKRKKIQKANSPTPQTKVLRVSALILIFELKPKN